MKCHQLFFFSHPLPQKLPALPAAPPPLQRSPPALRYAAPLCRGLPYNALGSLGLPGSTTPCGADSCNAHTSNNQVAVLPLAAPKPPNFPLPPHSSISYCGSAITAACTAARMSFFGPAKTYSVCSFWWQVKNISAGKFSLFEILMGIFTSCPPDFTRSHLRFDTPPKTSMKPQMRESLFERGSIFSFKLFVFVGV